MVSDGGDSFLPRIQSVFYAVFDVRQGPKIVHQVPEGLIGVPPPALSSALSIPPTPSVIDQQSASSFPVTPTDSRNSSASLISPSETRTSSYGFQSPQKRSMSLNRILFNFDDISKYVIPQPALCGRLVICATQRYRVIGFPVNLRGKYDRNYFRYNLCFVFERSADLSCYEPIVRKVSRVLTTCEEESRFLSDPKKSPALHAVLEQLYEDLNSYSETSVPIDNFNSIELKIFPFYPNPPPVQDWMVPLALINLTKRIEPNWDLTMAKVCRHINGVDHVAKIAHLADCDLELTRQAISHLLYYQVIMTIDIFQYQNMYTLRKTIQWAAEEAHVREECGPYVTKSGKPIPDWPKLLHLYSRLKPKKTVLEWMEEYKVEDLNVDVRRFTSFGVIKGFLRRIHRYPILLAEHPRKTLPTQKEVTRGNDSENRHGSIARLRFPAELDLPPVPEDFVRGRPPLTAPSQVPTFGEDVLVFRRDTARTDTATPERPRRISAAEQVLEELKSKDLQKTGIVYSQGTTNTPSTARNRPERRRLSITQAPPPSPVLSKTVNLTAPPRPRLSRSPSVPVLATSASANSASNVPPYPSEFVKMLDGEHHADELATKFQVGWPILDEWLQLIGGGPANGEGEYGKVAIIYR